MCLSKTCGTCPFPALTSSQQALFKCHRDVSHLYRLYVDCTFKLCSEFSSLITMSSLVWSSATKAPFTGALCLLSSISLEFHCSGWEVPEASRQTWNQWWNMVCPSPVLQTPMLPYQWWSQGAVLKASFPEKWHCFNTKCPWNVLLPFKMHIRGKLDTVQYRNYFINLTGCTLSVNLSGETD